MTADDLRDLTAKATQWELGKDAAESLTNLAPQLAVGYAQAIDAITEIVDAGKRHGRGCACTPCRAEDWDAVERGIREAQDAGNSPERLEGMDVQALANTVRQAIKFAKQNRASPHPADAALDALVARVEELAQRVAELEAELARIREERDDLAEQVRLRDENAFDGASIARVIDQREAAEARCARLEQALRAILGPDWWCAR